MTTTTREGPLGRSLRQAAEESLFNPNAAPSGVKQRIIHDLGYTLSKIVAIPFAARRISPIALADLLREELPHLDLDLTLAALQHPWATFSGWRFDREARAFIFSPTTA